MRIAIESGDITAARADAIVVNLFEGVTSPGGGTGAVDRALGGAISDLIAEGEVRGKSGEMTLIHTLGRMATRRVLVAGLGKADEFDLDAVRTVSARAARFLRARRVRTAATIAHGAGIGGLEPRACGRAIAEGAVLGLYRFDKYKSEDDPAPELESMSIVEFDPGRVDDLSAGAREGEIVAGAVALCRDLVNEPGNRLTPADLAEAALGVAREADIELEVLGEDRMRELGMGALLGVAAGSHLPPRLIVMRYAGDPDDPGNSLGLLGKGITFDTGGISIKPAVRMGEMKTDMAGAASVIAAMKAIAALRPRINVTAIAAVTENMPGGGAQRPGDIVTAMNGKTIEVDNTDAEGRLVLADAACYAVSLGLGRLVDVATLTGAMTVALGTVATGAFGNDRALMDAVLAAGRGAGERVWEMPTYKEYRRQLDSDVADIRNIGGRAAGSITGAMFIGEFVGDAAWVHLDIAATARSGSVRGWRVKGATGVPVRTLVDLAVSLAR